VKNDSQCNYIFNNKCTFIFDFDFDENDNNNNNNDNDNNNNGTCVERNNSDYKCEDIKRRSQCEDGGKIEILKDMCDIYGVDLDRCEVKCMMMNDNDTCESYRTNGWNDCFWIMNDEDNTITTQCVNKV
jgi:hypothetical protein